MTGDHTPTSACIFGKSNKSIRRIPIRVWPGMRASVRRRSHGLVAQWESVRLTRGRSLVRTQPGPPSPQAASDISGAVFSWQDTHFTVTGCCPSDSVGSSDVTQSVTVGTIKSVTARLAEELGVAEGR